MRSIVNIACCANRQQRMSKLLLRRERPKLFVSVWKACQEMRWKFYRGPRIRFVVINYSKTERTFSANLFIKSKPPQKSNSTCFADAFQLPFIIALKITLLCFAICASGKSESATFAPFRMFAYILSSSIMVVHVCIVGAHYYQTSSAFNVFYLLRFSLRFVQCSIKYSVTDLIARGYVTMLTAVKPCESRESFENVLVKHMQRCPPFRTWALVLHAQFCFC